MTRTPILLASVLALCAAGLACSGKSSAPPEPVTETLTVTVTEPAPTEPPATATVAAPPDVGGGLGPGTPERQVQFGHIAALERREGAYLLRFDPAQYLTGLAASQAALEDTGSSDVPNDNYVVDEGHRLFTYRVPADARVTVLADGVEASPVTVAQLAKLVKGMDPLGHPLFEPLETGVWILVEADTVRSIHQQYVP